MALPVPHSEPEHHPIAAFVERHDTLRMIMEWIADRFADTASHADDSIAWEDGEDHDDPQGPSTL